MEAKIIKLDKLLQENTIFKTPFIQRDFVWEREVDQLIEDLILHGKNKDSTEYFIGTIIIREQEHTSLDGITHSILYEGQQRCVTITLIYFALYLFYRENPGLVPDGLDDYKILLKYVYGNLDKSKIKLCLNVKDQTRYQEILAEQFENDTSIIHQAFKKIRRRVNKTNHLHILRGLTKLKCIEVLLGPEDNADVIFDTVNTRGKALKLIDKLRNICLLNLEPKIQEEMYQKKWMPFYDKLEEYHFMSNDMMSSWVAGFLLQHTGNLSNSSLQDAMIKWLRAYPPKTAMRLLSEYNTILINMIENNRFSQSVSQLLAIKQPCAIFGVHLLDQASKDDKITFKESETIINMFISYCLRMWIMGDASKRIREMVRNIHHIVFSGSFSVAKDIMNLFNPTLSRVDWRGIPSDENITTRLMSKEWRRNLDAQILLTLLENKLNARCGDLSHMELEHIHPNSETIKQDNNTNYAVLLGNLTLLPRGLNSRLSNHDFSFKKTAKGGFNESTLMIDEYVKQQKHWGIPEITERTALLTEEICNTWPNFEGVVKEGA